MLEALCELQYDAGIDNYVLISAVYSSVASPLDRRTLYPALRQVIEQHPALCVQLSGNAAGTLHFVRLPSIDLDEVVTFSPETSATYEAVLTAELAHRVRGTTLWRLTVLKDNTVIFEFHHAIGDGRSGLAFHRSLLNALNTTSPSQPISGTVVETPASITLATPVELATNVSVSISTFFRLFLENRVLPRSWLPGTSAWSGLPCPSQPHRRACVRLHTINPTDAKLLLTLCRKHGCTLNGFLHTLAIYVLSNIVHKLNATRSVNEKYTSLSAGIAIDLRPLTGCSEHTMTTQASGHTYHVPLLDPSRVLPPTDVSFPWDAAKEYSREVQGYRDKAKEIVGLLKILYKRRDPVQFLNEKLGKKRDLGLRLSNLGRFAPAPESNGRTSVWSIGEVWYCSSNPTTGAALTITAVGSPSGTVNIAYNWGDDAVEDGVGDVFVTGMKEGVQSLLHAS